MPQHRRRLGVEITALPRRPRRIEKDAPEQKWTMWKETERVGRKKKGGVKTEGKELKGELATGSQWEKREPPLTRESGPKACKTTYSVSDKKMYM